MSLILVKETGAGLATANAYATVAETNSIIAQPYARAVFCDGFAAGLGMGVQAAKVRAKPVLPPVPRYVPDPGWPLLRARD